MATELSIGSEMNQIPTTVHAFTALTLLNSLGAFIFIIMYGYRRKVKDTYQKLPNCTN